MVKNNVWTAGWENAKTNYILQILKESMVSKKGTVAEEENKCEKSNKEEADNKRAEIKFYCVKYVVWLCNENEIESYITESHSLADDPDHL